VATDIFGVSGRAMLEALIAGERNPVRLAELARGRLRVKRAALVEALTGQFSDHHARLARILLHQIDGLTAQIDQLTTLIEKAIAALPAAQAPAGGPDPGAIVGARDPAQGPLPAMQRLDEVPGIGPKAAQVIIAELGLDMGQFPTPGHLVSWAKIAPQTIQSGAKRRAGPTGKGNPYLRGTLGEVAAAAAKTDTFPWASASGGWSAAAASSRRWSPSPAPSWSSSGTCWPTPPPASATWAPTTTPAASTRAARPAAWSANSRPSAIPSPCNPPHSPDRPRADPIPPPPTTRLRCAPPGAAAYPLRWSFSGQDGVRAAPRPWSAHHRSEDQELSGSLPGGSWPVTCRDPALGTNTDCEPVSHRTVISRPSTAVTTPLRVTLPTFSDSTSTRSPTSIIVASCGVVTKPGLPKCPLRRAAPFKMSATIVLAAQSSYPGRLRYHRQGRLVYLHPGARRDDLPRQTD
jgi:hypothetical protein